MLDFILDCTKVLKMICNGLISVLIINGVTNFIIKQLQFNEVIEAFFRKINKKNGEDEEKKI